MVCQTVKTCLKGDDRRAVQAKRRRLPRQEAQWHGKYTIESGPSGVWGACEILDISILGARRIATGCGRSRVAQRGCGALARSWTFPFSALALNFLRTLDFFRAPKE